MVSFKPNTFTPQTTSFFRNFTPYEELEGIIVTDELAEMVSYNILPIVEPTVISQNIGAVDVYEFTLSVKNLTQNTLLNIEIQTQEYFNVSNNNFTIYPEQVNDVVISINNDAVNRANVPLEFLTQITLVIKNVPNTTFAIKRVDIEELEKIALPSAITVN